MNPETARKLSLTLIAPIILFLIALRFFHLDADFPLGITWSGDLYTDEGWYSNAAVRDVVSGHWYQAGDFNPAVNLPVGQLLQRAIFAMFGLGLIPARLSAAMSSSAVILLAGLFVYRGPVAPRHGSLQAGLLTALVLASSYVGFAFSRLAILEPVGMVFVMAALLLAQRADGRFALPRLILSALLVAAAALVKGSMVFAVPVVAYAACLNGAACLDGKSRRPRALPVGVFLLTSCVVIIGWQVIARHGYAADYDYFNSLNLGARRVTGILDWFANLRRQFVNMLALGRGFVDVCVLLIVLAAAFCAGFRAMPAVRILLAYALAYFGLLSIVSYGPPRYFVPLLVPMAGLSAIACVELARWCATRFRPRLPALLAPALLILLVLSGCGRIAAYMVRPHYSFLHMTAAVTDILGHRPAHPVLLAEMADSVAVATGVRAVNTDMGTLPLRARIERYRPSYLLVHTDAAETLGAIRAAGGRTTPLGAWNVFGNYYGSGQDIELFAIDWGRPGQPSAR